MPTSNKRPCPSTPEGYSLSKRRRGQGPTSSTPNDPNTTLAWAELRHVHDISITRDQFIGLCSYLVVILDWGYNIIDHDQFIVRYPAYEKALPDLHQPDLDAPYTRIPSYHTWLQPQNLTSNEVASSSGASGSCEVTASILSHSVLHSITEEYPYTTLLTRLSLEALMKKSLEGDARRALCQKLRRLEAKARQARQKRH